MVIPIVGFAFKVRFWRLKFGFQCIYLKKKDLSSFKTQIEMHFYRRKKMLTVQYIHAVYVD